MNTRPRTPLSSARKGKDAVGYSLSMKPTFLLFLVYAINNCLLCVYAGFKSKVSRQNVLYIIVDDLRPTLGSYNYTDTPMVTPNLDNLAHHSVVFTRAYVQQALCGPSRASFLTSRRPDTTRVYDLDTYWREAGGNFTTLPQHFKLNGYHTISVGKVFHPGQASGGTDDYPYSWSQSPYHPSTQRYKMAKVCPEADGGLYMDVVCPVELSEQPEETLPDIQSTQYAVGVLKNLSSIPHQKPFFLAVGYHKPHIPLKYPRQFKKLYPLSHVHLAPDPTLPVKLPEAAWNPWMDLRRRHDVQSLNVSFPYGPIPVKFQLLLRQSYYAAVSYIDDQIGRLLSALDKYGFSRNTVVVLHGDHGWSLGEHQEWSKYSNFEVAVRVPLMVYIPGKTSHRRNNVNIFPYINPLKEIKPQQLPQNKQTSIHLNINNSNPQFSEHLKLNLSTLQHSKGYYSDVIVELVDILPTVTEIAGLSTVPKCPKKYSSSVLFCTEGKSLVLLINYITMSNRSADRIVPNSTAFSQYPRPSRTPAINSDEPSYNKTTIVGYSLRTDDFRYTEWVKLNSSTGKCYWGDVYGRELYKHGGVKGDLEDSNLIGDTRFISVIKHLSNMLHTCISCNDFKQIKGTL